ncbi:MAG: Uma2 family endonuclease [Truepera sp.]|nr:Uma2 family endonuclease [Truepera sp.]
MGESVRPLAVFGVEEYLQLEAAAAVKHEYVAGGIYAMAGSSQRHNQLALNLVIQLWPRAQAAGCRVYASDMKVRIGDEAVYYPDVVVTCSAEPHPLYLECPCLIVEVLSPSTEGTDHREKLLNYQKLASLQAYLLVDSESRRAEGYYRDQGGWLYRLVEEEGELPFACLDLKRSLSAIYGAVSVPGEAS